MEKHLSKPVDVATIYKNDPKLKKDDVTSLINWISNQPHLPKITEMQAILFIHSCYYSLEKAKNALDTFFTLRTMCPELFAQLSPQNPNIITALNVSLITPLPRLTPEGYVVAFNRLLDVDPNKYLFSDQAKVQDMIGMAYLNNYGPCNGVVSIIDLHGSGISHLWRIHVMTIKKFLFYLQEGMPVRIMGIHFINVTPFVDKVVSMIKPFMKKDLLQVLHLHSGTNETLYQFVPKECLPEELGGQSPSISILHEKSKKFVNDNAAFFEFQEKQIVDESKRPGKPKNVDDFFAVDGSFRKLLLD